MNGLPTGRGCGDKVGVQVRPDMREPAETKMRRCPQ